MDTPQEAPSLPGVRELLRQLRAGAVVYSHGHTLASAPELGPCVLHGLNPRGQSYYGSLSARYLHWWRSRVAAGQTIGEPSRGLGSTATTEQPGDVLMDDFLDQPLSQAGPLGQLSQPQPRPGPGLPGPWAQRVIATRLVELLDGHRFSVWQVDRLGQAFGSILPAMGRAWREPKDHPDYAALKVLHFDPYRQMEPGVAAGLPDALLRVLGLDHALLHELLGDCAGMVVERFARGVALPEPTPEPAPAPVPEPEPDAPPTPRIAPESLTRPVSGWRRLFGMGSAPAGRAH